MQQALSVKVCWDSFDRNNEILKNILKLKTTSYPHALYFKGQKWAQRAAEVCLCAALQLVRVLIRRKSDPPKVGCQQLSSFPRTLLWTE